MMRRCRHRRVRHGRRRRVLPARWTRTRDHARIFVEVGVIAGLIALRRCRSFPPAICTASYVAKHQPAPLAAMEGLFTTRAARRLAIIGQPDVETPDASTTRSSSPTCLSFLIYGTTGAEVKGLDAVPARPVARQHPAALLQLPHHGRARDAVRRGHGARRAFLLWRGRLFTTRAGCSGS